MSLIVAHSIRTQESSVSLWGGSDWRRAVYKNEIWGLGETAGYRYMMLTKNKEDWGQTDQENQQGKSKKNQESRWEKKPHALMIEVMLYDLQLENTINTNWNSLLPSSKIYNENLANSPFLPITISSSLGQTEPLGVVLSETIYVKASNIVKSKWGYSINVSFHFLPCMQFEKGTKVIKFMVNG